MSSRERTYYVYILTSNSGTFYTGVTNSISIAHFSTKTKKTAGFTSKYDVNRLVYYECFSDVLLAIRREKEIKGWMRKKKMALIESKNPKWADLAKGWGELLPRQPWQIRDPLADQRHGDSSGPKRKIGPLNDKRPVCLPIHPVPCHSERPWAAKNPEWYAPPRERA